MKDSTILIIVGGVGAALVGGAYLLIKAKERAEQKAGAAVGNAACEAQSVPRNLLNGLSSAVLGRKMFGSSCTDRRDQSTYSAVPECSAGFHWDGNQKKCVVDETLTKPSSTDPATQGNLLSGNRDAPITSSTNPWGQDTIITRPSGEQIEVHPVTAPTGYKVVYALNSDGSNCTNCPDGSPTRIDPANGKSYCIVPEFAMIMNPAVKPGLPGNPANTGPLTTTPTTTSSVGAGNNVLGFNVGTRNWDETAW